MELENNPPPGSYESSVVQFGCEDCPYSHRLVTGWLSVTKLVEMMDIAGDMPRAFVSGSYELIGKAEACPDQTLTEQEPNCKHKDELKTIITRSQPFPD